MPAGFKISGIAPAELRQQPDAVKLMYWHWVADLAVVVKDRELAKGLDAKGEDLRRISPQTRKRRKSAMTPGGKGDPAAPPMTPGHKLSRTRSLLAAKAFTTHVHVYWRFDPFTHASWSKILTYQRDDQGRDVFGISDAGIETIRKQALAKWMTWKRHGAVIAPEYLNQRSVAPVQSSGPLPPVAFTGSKIGPNAVFGIGRQTGAGLKPGTWSGGHTEAELKAAMRATAPAAVQGRPGAAYNRILSHTWGQPAAGSGGGAVSPLTPEPKAPRPKRAAMKQAKPKTAEKATTAAPKAPAPSPLQAIERFARAAIAAARAVPQESRYGSDVTGFRVWISDAYARFIALHPEMSFDEFKRLLLRANRLRLVTMSRADMPHAIPEAERPKIWLSEIIDGPASFHWIRL